MVSYELILYLKNPNLLGKGNTISSYKHLYFEFHFIQNVSHSKKNGETNKKKPLKDQGH